MEKLVNEYDAFKREKEEQQLEWKKNYQGKTIYSDTKYMEELKKNMKAFMDEHQGQTILEVQAALAILKNNCTLLANMGDSEIMNEFKLWWEQISKKLKLVDKEGKEMPEKD